ncbi:MAG: FtsX-like permease family protein [Pseudochelatococcus sp.]|jgi:putative ABC transport system permease protein|uniref:FtsX-like permease family protein n=1 Tax=Pseudochelatococcus sp. TaxID=2020869 RepID=UPI003D8DC1CB
MIPVRFILADLRRLWAGSLVIVLLIGLATALGIAVGIQERALRLGSARAADRFDVIVGAAGSETQLVLSSVFLQPAPLTLLPGAVLKKLSEDPRVAWAAPVGFGDSFQGSPIVGTTNEFLTDKGQRPLAEGEIFRGRTDAVIGALVDLRQGDTVKPIHGQPGEGGHSHDELAYTVTGRLAPTGTPWDRAILVPIETVWSIHGMGAPASAGTAEADDHDHDHDGAQDHAAADHLGPPWHDDIPGVPAIIVKPRSIANAYQIRQEYRADTTVGVFPAEVLTRLYATLGDARLVLTAIAIGTQALVGAAVVLVSVVHLSQRRRQIGALRALGAPRGAIFGVVWVELLLLIGLGVGLGVGLGYVGAKVAASVFTRESGIVLPVTLEAGDIGFAGLLLLVAAVIALVPAWLAYRQPPAAALRA